jgi:hypothetical protein
MRRLIVALMCLAISSVPAAAAGPAEGEWQGSGVIANTVTVYTLTLTQDGDNVKGIYQVGSGRMFPVTGIASGSSVALKVVGDADAYINLTIAEDGKTMEAAGLSPVRTTFSVKLTKRR